MIQLVEGRKHQVIKRDGRYENYSPEKMYKVLLWACNGSEVLAKELLNDIDLKVYDKISIQKLFDEVIETAANKISDMFPIWDSVARNLFIQKIYKEVWGIKRDEYPNYLDVLKKGVSYGIYDREVIASFTEEEINELGNYIDQKRDFNLSYLGLRVFMDKYSAHYTPTKNLELPQHGFMRLAIFAFWKEKENRLDLIKRRYDDLSLLRYSEATPKWLNSLTPNAQMASCVVSKMPDDSWGINKTVSNLGLFSKYGGGLACDVSSLRATGSKIRKAGESSGPIPFIRMIESVVSAYNQLGKRNGACCVYFPWWHYDSPEMIELKEEGGTEDRRARKLQYGVKWNRLFTERILADEEITLFDPKDTPELLETWGEEFKEWYLYYEEKPKIKKKKIKAVDLAYSIAKQRIETGNIYLFFEENVQNQNNFDLKIYSSNLCVAGDTEIIISVEGSIYNVKIAELDMILEKYKDVEVLSFNTKTRLKEYKKILDFAQTSPKAKVMKITDEETGKQIICTPDHQIWTENRGYVLAKDLREDDVLNLAKTNKTSELPLKIEYLEEEIPVYDITVEDNQNFYANEILVHNCNEIYLPTLPPEFIKSNLTKDLSADEITLSETSHPGQIALCNLSSINLVVWDKMSEEEKDKMCYNLLRASDNLLDYAFYPAKEGEIFNRLFRAIGVGVTNDAQLIASYGFDPESEDALKLTNDIQEDIYWYLMKNSIQLAAERGRFEMFDQTKYKQGLFSFDLYQGPFNYELNHDWDSLREDLKRIGARFSTVMAVAPTSTSGLILNSTEGIEPPRKFVSIKTGTYNCKQLVPNLNKYRQFYKLAWDISPESMINRASVRQRWVDQGQSFSLYYKDRNDSAFEILKDIVLAESRGLKGLYYAHSPKEDEEIEVCESCSS